MIDWALERLVVGVLRRGLRRWLPPEEPEIRVRERATTVAALAEMTSDLTGAGLFDGGGWWIDFSTARLDDDMWEVDLLRTVVDSRRHSVDQRLVLWTITYGPEVLEGPSDPVQALAGMSYSAGSLTIRGGHGTVCRVPLRQLDISISRP